MVFLLLKMHFSLSVWPSQKRVEKNNYLSFFLNPMHIHTHTHTTDLGWCYSCFQLFPHQCLSSTRWWGRGCAVWSKELTLSYGWPCPELLPEHPAGSSSKVSSMKSERFFHYTHIHICTHTYRSAPFIFSIFLGSSDVTIIWHYLLWQTVCVTDRRPVPVHLPLAWTHTSPEEIQSFMTQLETLARVVQSQPDAELNVHMSPSRPQFVWTVIEKLHHMSLTH